ncbi:hypothetical protein [Rummeliibacillus sp. SL167]|uniref:hypothetical protein n=1 Tax=Rummeliibacillus sp. SL167 TaxID=2579792 RepID=UPI0011B6410D|nr:hypothetical protein [Rummeliibacillus sp. SL167]
MNRHRSHIMIIGFILSITLMACGRSDTVDTLKKMEVTIQIEDATNAEQRYLIHIMTDGKETDKTTVLPQNMSLITNDKKEITTSLYTNIPYTIRVYKTDKKSMDEYFSKPKSGSSETEPQKDNLLASKTITPTQDTKIIKITLPKQ